MDATTTVDFFVGRYSQVRMLPFVVSDLQQLFGQSLGDLLLPTENTAILQDPKTNRHHVRNKGFWLCIYTGKDCIDMYRLYPNLLKARTHKHRTPGISRICVYHIANIAIHETSQARMRLLGKCWSSWMRSWQCQVLGGIFGSIPGMDCAKCVAILR